ncbi:MAG: hypothetical protein J1F67_09480 [Muribaculaceae bacterium]|nr:hypothetical protein [Muribaculaceae bacterium]
MISGGEGKQFQIYSIEGRLIKSFRAESDAEKVSLVPGWYIVFTEGISEKVIVK